ncbi:hypothetical protein KJ567_06020 [Candidatus Bipolaricaulota bacterium]|nr:hypothetical protein [Candidatus Bipolaricaulota bacterium]
MPIVDVEIVVGEGGTIDADLAPKLADAVGAVLGTTPGRTWVRVRALPDAHYAEDGGGPPAGIRPVFVTVLKSMRPEGERLREETRRLTEAIAAACDRPVENVHVLWLPDANGRMAFGGRLVE